MSTEFIKSYSGVKYITPRQAWARNDYGYEVNLPQNFVFLKQMQQQYKTPVFSVVDCGLMVCKKSCNIIQNSTDTFWTWHEAEMVSFRNVILGHLKVEHMLFSQIVVWFFSGGDL